MNVQVQIHGHALHDELRLEIRNADGQHHMWAMSRDAAEAATPELLRAMGAGTVTVGGMAELGWRYLGQVEPGAVFR